MTRKPIRLLGAVAAIVLAGVAVAALSRNPPPPSSPSAAVVDMNHGNVRFAKGQERHVLNALAATTASTPPDELAAEGRKIFRDPSLFEDGESCQTCHAEGTASPRLGTMVHDTQAKNLSPMPPNDFDGPRDPPSLIGIAKTPPFFWDGDVPTLQKAAERPVFGHMKKFVTGDCRPVTPAANSGVPANPGRDAACDTEAGQIAAKLVAYLKTLDPPTTAFDEGTLSPAALRGEKIFQGKGACIECHGGPLFTDNLVHNTGVPQVKFTSPYGTGTRLSNDLGAKPPQVPAECGGATPPAGCEDKLPGGGAFINTPQLRDLKNTAPYMHNGAFKTLADVVQFYDTQSIVAPLNLTPQEEQDLVAYLESL